MNILGYSINTDYPVFPVTRQEIINTINPHCYCVAKKDSMYQDALQHSSLLIPDGIGIVLAAKILNGEKIPRIAGSDIHKYLLEKAQTNKLKVFYLGSNDSTLVKITERISKDYPNVRVGYHSPPFKSEFSLEENQKMCDVVNRFSPDILFVGMTAPKQEKWIYKNKSQLNVNVICAIGAVFDFYAGTVKRPDKFWISLGLEWFPRLIREPRRLWRRTLISTPLFVWSVIYEKFKSFSYNT